VKHVCVTAASLSAKFVILPGFASVMQSLGHGYGFAYMTSIKLCDNICMWQSNVTVDKRNEFSIIGPAYAGYQYKVK